MNTGSCISKAVRVAALSGTGLIAAFALAVGLPAQINVSDLLVSGGGNGEVGLVINGSFSNDRLGSITRSGGDLNGDGFDDLVISAPFASSSGLDEAGRTYIIYGSQTPIGAEFDLTTLSVSGGGDGSVGFEILGPAAFSRSGTSLDFAGDINNDGLEDLIIGAPSSLNSNDGVPDRAFVVFGRDTNFFVQFELLALFTDFGGDGSQGFVLEGSGDARFGQDVSGIGDINNDGIDDFAVGATREPDNGLASAGAAYVFFGKSTAYDAVMSASALEAVNGGDGSAGFVVRGEEALSRLGSSISAAGDINNDGIDDLIIGEPGVMLDPDFNDFPAGRAVIIYGRDDGFPAEIDTASLLPENGGDGSAGFVVGGFTASNFGRTVGGGYDVNCDGISDAISGYYEGGAYTGFPFSGVSVILGSSTGFPASFLLNDTSRVARLTADSDSFGYVVGMTEDANSDGCGDILVGDPLFEEFFATPGVGSGYLINGGLQIAGSFDADNLNIDNGGDGALGTILEDDIVGGALGFTQGSVGDINGDGATDFAFSQPRRDTQGLSDNGRIVVVYGEAGIADLDGDGVSDDVDNCLETANPEQRDSDGDGFGNICDTDLNNDCVSNFQDLGILRTVYFTFDEDADFNGDGVVSTPDLGIMRLRFFSEPGPSALGSCSS